MPSYPTVFGSAMILTFLSSSSLSPRLVIFRPPFTRVMVLYWSFTTAPASLVMVTLVTTLLSSALSATFVTLPSTVAVTLSPVGRVANSPAATG